MCKWVWFLIVMYLFDVLINKLMFCLKVGIICLSIEINLLLLKVRNGRLLFLKYLVVCRFLDVIVLLNL